MNNNLPPLEMIKIFLFVENFSYPSINVNKNSKTANRQFQRYATLIVKAS